MPVVGILRQYQDTILTCQPRYISLDGTTDFTDVLNHSLVSSSQEEAVLSSVWVARRNETLKKMRTTSAALVINQFTSLMTS